MLIGGGGEDGFGAGACDVSAVGAGASAVGVGTGGTTYCTCRVSASQCVDVFVTGSIAPVTTVCLYKRLVLSRYV